MLFSTTGGRDGAFIVVGESASWRQLTHHCKRLLKTVEISNPPRFLLPEAVERIITPVNNHHAIVRLKNLWDIGTMFLKNMKNQFTLFGVLA